MKTAKEMREISEKNALTIEIIQERIEANASMGDTSIFFIECINIDTLNQILKNGYKISKIIDHLNGRELTKIEW